MKYIVELPDSAELPSWGYMKNAEKYKPKTITESLQELAGQICDNICKWPERCERENELYDEHCEHCPLVELL